MNTHQFVATYRRVIKTDLGKPIKSVLKIPVRDVDPNTDPTQQLFEASIFYNNMKKPKGFSPTGIKKVKKVETT